MATPSNSYATLKALDAATTTTLVAQTAQAMMWDAERLALWCKLTGADPAEVATIVRADRERGHVA